METEKKMTGKAYQAPVMESVDVELQALICNSCTSDQVSGCGGILSFGGGGCNSYGTCSSNAPRSREDSSWDED